MSTSLTGLFGKSPRVELLEVFGEYADDDLSVPFLHEHVSASVSTIHKYLGELVREGLVVLTVKEGKTQYYKLNLTILEGRIIAYLQNKFLADELAEQLHEMGELTLSVEAESAGRVSSKV